MGSTKSDTLASLATELLSQRAMTGFEIARALEIHHRLSIRGREGAIYAALIQLERDGWIVSERGTDGRILYSLPTLADVGDRGGEA